MPLNGQNDSLDKITECVKSDAFVCLPEKTQGDVLSSIKDHESQTGGILGKIFGTDEKKAAVYAGICTCVFLIIAWSGFTIFGIYENRTIDLKFLEGLLMFVAGFLFAKSSN